MKWGGGGWGSVEEGEEGLYVSAAIYNVRWRKGERVNQISLCQNETYIEYYRRLLSSIHDYGHMR